VCFACLPLSDVIAQKKWDLTYKLPKRMLQHFFLFLTFDDGQGGMTASSSIHRQLEGG